MPFPMEQLGFHDVDSVVLLMQDVINISYKGRGRIVDVLKQQIHTPFP